MKLNRLKINLFLIVLLSFSFVFTVNSWAIPNLQIYIPGATYDSGSETWIIDAYDYQLWVIGANYNVYDVKLAFAVPTDETGYIDVTWLDTSFLDPSPGTLSGLSPGQSDYGGAAVTYLTLDESNGMDYTLYREEYDEPEEVPNADTYGFSLDGTPFMGDGSQLPPHGVFPTDFYEYFIGDFGTDETIFNYIPGEEFGDSGSGQIKAFDISVSGYSWVDIVAYDHVVKSVNKGKYKYVFTPFSHDGSSTPVPEPATVLLLGSGLAGLAGFRRKIRKQL